MNGTARARVLGGAALHCYIQILRYNDILRKKEVRRNAAGKNGGLRLEVSHPFASVFLEKPAKGWGTEVLYDVE
jgi:hypothetical protein